MLKIFKCWIKYGHNYYWESEIDFSNQKFMIISTGTCRGCGYTKRDREKFYR